LYSHAIESALKSFLRAANIPIGSKRKHHRLVELYEECKGLGLKTSADDRFDVRNVLVLLQNANENQEHRYFSMKSSGNPELSWTREATETLIRAVEPSVKSRAQGDGIVSGRPVKAVITWNKPKMNVQ
jgi:hypothetical protein